MKTLHLVMITILLTGFAFLANQTTSECIIFCQVGALQPPFLQIDKNVYLKGDIMLLYGSIGNYTQGYNITAKIFDNQENVVLTQVTYPRQDSTFLLRIPTNEYDWKTGGPYDLKVWYGSCCYIGDHTFTFYADQLPPLKQEEAEMAFWNIKCNSGLAVMMKQEDGSIACVRPGSLQKLISLKWGYDPSEKLTTYGLKNIYRVGQEIDFKFRVNGFGNSCEQPTVIVRNSDQKIIWQSSQYATGCANGLVAGNVKDEAYLGRESHLGYDYNQYGPLIINQTGTYFMNISWLDGNITKEFSITPPIVQQTSGNATLPDSFMPCDTPYPRNSTGETVLYMPANSTGKLCVRYHNLGDNSRSIGIRISEANSLDKDAPEITTWNDSGNNTLLQGNSTVIYWIKTGNHAGFYGLTIFCVPMPFAVGYDSNSTFVKSDFPWLGSNTWFCPLQDYNFRIESLTGIGVKQIP